MSAVAMEILNQLNPEEQNIVVDYAQYILSKRKEKALKLALDSFHALRNEALKNRPEGMTLDEINTIIKETREEKHNKYYIVALRGKNY